MAGGKQLGDGGLRDNYLESRHFESNPTLKSTVFPHILQIIAVCESGDRQFNEDGSVVRGKINPHDIGRFQINEIYHLEEARALGMDIYTDQGNRAYALHLYKLYGTTPWNWSKATCWGKEGALP